MKNFFQMNRSRQKTPAKSLPKSHRKSPSKNTHQILFTHAKQLYQLKNLPQAQKLFEQYLTIYPNHDESIYLCAVCNLHQGNYRQAIEKLEAVSEEYPMRSQAMLLMSMAYYKMNDITSSLEIINECIRKYEILEEAICFRGKIYMSQKYYMKAQNDFKTAISFKNATFLSYVALGDCYNSQSKPERAIQLYKKSLQILRKCIQHSQEPHQSQILLKLAVCHYTIEEFEQCEHILLTLLRQTEVESIKCSELYYYLGQSQLQLPKTKKKQGLLNLEYSLRLQTNAKIQKKSYKILIGYYLSNYLFYEAININKLANICEIDVPGWNQLVEGLMKIIKADFSNGLLLIQEVYDKIKIKKSTRIYKFKNDQVKQRYSIEKNSQKVKQKQFFGNMVQSPKNFSQNIRNLSFLKNKTKKPLLTNTKTRSATKVGPPQVFYPTQRSEPPFNLREQQQLMPIVLCFKAYAQFFLNKFVKCLETYEQYETYLRDIYGKQSDISYNKSICESILMFQSQLHDDALDKYSYCIDKYFQKYGTIPTEPVVFKIIHLIKLAIIQSDNFQSCQKVFEETLSLINSYQLSISQNPHIHYYKGLLLILMERDGQAREQLEKALKVCQECNWRFLYSKGLVEMMLENFTEAAKQFSAGLVLEERSEFYLARSICFLRLSNKHQQKPSQKSLGLIMKSIDIAQCGESKNQQKKLSNSELLIENSFEDLQKYIQMEPNHEQISYWVTKILFFSRAYDQSLRSIAKVQIQTEEIVQIQQCLYIYEGQFTDGGVVGVIVKSAFEGKFLDQKQEELILERCPIKNYNSFQVGYLTKQYEKWLVILDLYSKNNFILLLKYLQNNLFGCLSEQTEIILRYNIAVIYLLLNDFTKAGNAIKMLLKNTTKYPLLQEKISKIQNLNFENDECLADLREEVGVGYARMLSNYLPFRSVSISQGVSIFVKITVMFPEFSKPNVELKIDQQYVLKQLDIKLIEKKIQAPWIRKNKINSIQFTESIEQQSLDQNFSEIASNSDEKTS